MMWSIARSCVASAFKDILDDQISRHLPRKIIVEGQKRKPQWLSYKTVKLVERKHQLYVKYDKHPGFIYESSERCEH